MDIELEAIRAGGQARIERRDGVLGAQRPSAAVREHERASVGALGW
jgi:hypothetical protein